MADDSSSFGIDDFLRDVTSGYSAYTQSQIAQDNAATASTQANNAAKVLAAQSAQGVTPAWLTPINIIIGLVVLIGGVFLIKKL